MDERVYELLNDQINQEMDSAYLYMSFACLLYTSRCV